jgi:hypothetical protein
MNFILNFSPDSYCLRGKFDALPWVYNHLEPNTLLSAFRDGVPKPTSEMSPRAPAQMGRHEAEREVGKWGGRR